MVVGGGLTLTPAEKYWWLGAAISFAALCAILWFNWLKHALRTHRMKRGFTVHFTTDKGRTTFQEMHWPANSDLSMQLRMTPRFHFRQYEVIFGFMGNPSARPIPLKVVNTFIAQGLRREQSPDDTETHSIDHKGNYHIQETRERTKPNVYAYGFFVRTREPGRYPIRFELITDCGEGKSVEPLVLVVEERSPKPAGT